LPNSGISDLVGYGNVTCFEGSGPTPAPNNTTAEIRKGSGCTDSDSNPNDFLAGAPNPHNLSSAPNLCLANLQFSAGAYNVGEGNGSVTVTVNRSGDTSGAVTVDYATLDVGSAAQRTDYTIGAGTLRFASGETSKTFEVLIVNDLYVESNENFNVTLSNPSSGAALGAPSATLITITDNDLSPPTTNPLDDPRFFVQLHYYDFLSRFPDTSGWDFWTNIITQCGADQTCIRTKRIDVSNAFFYELSSSRQDRTSFVCTERLSVTINRSLIPTTRM